MWPDSFASVPRCSWWCAPCHSVSTPSPSSSSPRYQPSTWTSSAPAASTVIAGFSPMVAPLAGCVILNSPALPASRS